MSTTNSR